MKYKLQIKLKCYNLDEDAESTLSYVDSKKVTEVLQRYVNQVTEWEEEVKVEDDIGSESADNSHPDHQ